ncbi:hypothetical protein GGI23_000232 [Coemansia sp. RSA 2559]|nr:hypothetical protein GGI23_000232 [Coemansia sp. RSA 2559]
MSLTTNTTILSMVPPKSASVPNVTVEGGDLYPKQREIEGSTSVSETDGASEPTNGLSKGQKIGIGVGVSLGAILVIIGCIIVYHIWNVKRQDKAWDPNAEALNLQDIAFDIAADDRLLVPPPYSQVNNEAGSNSRQPRETTDTKRR